MLEVSPRSFENLEPLVVEVEVMFCSRYPDLHDGDPHNAPNQEEHHDG